MFSVANAYFFLLNLACTSFCQPVQHLATLGALEAQLMPLLSLGQHLLCHVHCLATLWALGPSSPLRHPGEESEQYELP